MEELNKRLPEILNNIPVEQLKELPYFKNRGIMFLERCFIKDAQGERELAFSDTIKHYHESHGSFLGYTCKSERESEIAFTVFQWLSTNVGGSVLREALEACGQVIVYKKES